jgi:hypothetical protein
LGETERWFPTLAAAEIVVLGVAAVVAGWLAPGLDFDSGMATLYVGLLLAVAVSDILIVRFVVLPNNASSGVPRESLVVLGYAFVMAVAIFGLVASIVTGAGLIGLPFSVIAFVGYYAVWSFLQEAAGP